MTWEKLKQASTEDLIDWAETQPWCRAMANCVQDAEWHSEGDVWTHTKMVLEQLPGLEEWPSLTPQEQTVLKFTALFHDVAKPMTTEVDPETGRVTSPKHAVKGEHVARAVLRDLDCDLAIREQIARLVRYHGRPAFLLERDNPADEVVRLSWLLSNRLLYLFALADTRGRDTDAMSRPEENLHFWKLIALEENCFDQPFLFATDHARFKYFHSPTPGNRFYTPFEDFRCTVTMMAGLPGCGKDTWLSQHRSGLPVVSLDEIRGELDITPTENQGEVAQLARERCREYLRAGTSFAFNATNTLKQTRGRWIDLFADYGARIEIVYIEPRFETVLKQNKARSAAVPEGIIRKLAEKCEPPTWAECHRLIITDGVNEY
jgi:putative nucleotidyltransferase with HDIG domain